MISKAFLTKELRKLDRLCKTSSTDKEMLLRFSRLSVLELSAWTEDCMKDIVRNHAKRGIKSAVNLAENEKKIERTWGINYDRNFRPLLIHTIGIVSLDKLESLVDQNKFVALKGSLNTVTIERNNQAHQSIGVQTQIMTPALCMMHFLVIYDGLKDVQSKLRK